MKADAERENDYWRKRLSEQADMPITFLHAADIHLDSPLRGLERYEGRRPIGFAERVGARSSV